MPLPSWSYNLLQSIQPTMETLKLFLLFSSPCQRIRGRLQGRSDSQPDLASQVGEVPEYFTGDQNVSIFTIDDFPQEEDQTLLHVLRLMQWVFIWIEHFIPGPSSPFSYSWSFFSSAQLKETVIERNIKRAKGSGDWERPFAGRHCWGPTQTGGWAMLIQHHSHGGSNLYNRVMTPCHESMPWKPSQSGRRWYQNFQNPYFFSINTQS